MQRLAIIGLDCLAPKILFEEMAGELPTFDRLAARGAWGRLRSVLPPITIPAWMCAMTGQPPGPLGVYGFRSRRQGTYTDVELARSTDFTAPAVWDHVATGGGTVGLLGIPGTYPPPAVAGFCVSGIMTPGPDAAFTHPASVADALRTAAPGYVTDIERFRHLPRPQLLTEIDAMTVARFAAARALTAAHCPDLFAMVEIGSDRIHHGFWRFHDPSHPAYPGPGNPFEEAIPNYYRLLDRLLGQLLAALGDDTHVLVVSDHGAKAMTGCFALNQWLIEHGYLVLKGGAPPVPCHLADADVDWARTRAWAWGGYYARIFVNLEGREPQGCVASVDYEPLRDELVERLGGVAGPGGKPWRNAVLRPEEVYPTVRGNPPDLMGFFDDLSWRAAGTIGHPSMYLVENDTGPDDAVHDWDGVFLLAGPDVTPGQRQGARLLDVHPTALALMGLDASYDGPGRDLRGRPRLE